MASSPIAVIGMHRSGTSCLAGCLEDLGLNLGEVITWAPHNLKGNRENPRLWRVHDAVLERVGASWDEPPPSPVVWTTEEKASLKTCLTEYDALPLPWGFKDPRATVLLDGWFEVIPDLRLVATIRHPGAVAASLTARNGFDTDRGASIWTAYNRELLRWRALTPFPVIDYDAPNYESQVRAAAGTLGLKADAPMPFRDDDLRHQAERPLPPGAEDLWSELQAMTHGR